MRVSVRERLSSSMRRKDDEMRRGIWGRRWWWMRKNRRRGKKEKRWEGKRMRRGRTPSFPHTTHLNLILLTSPHLILYQLPFSPHLPPCPHPPLLSPHLHIHPPPPTSSSHLLLTLSSFNFLTSSSPLFPSPTPSPPHSAITSSPAPPHPLLFKLLLPSPPNLSPLLFLPSPFSLLIHTSFIILPSPQPHFLLSKYHCIMKTNNSLIL